MDVDPDDAGRFDVVCGGRRTYMLRAPNYLMALQWVQAIYGAIHVAGLLHLDQAATRHQAMLDHTFDEHRKNALGQPRQAVTARPAEDAGYGS